MPTPRMLPLVPLLALLALLPACGDDPAGGGAGAGRRAPRPAGPAWAQEVWVPYHDARHRPVGGFVPPPASVTPARARRLAEEARKRAVLGVDVGYLADRYGRTPWSPLGGYTGRLPARAGTRDARDRAALALPMGGLSPVYEWNAGFGFLRRVPRETAERLERRVRTANTLRAKARVIHIHHRGAEPARHEFEGFPREAAIEKARHLIREIQGGADFAALARRHSNAASTREAGGLLVWQGDPWVRWRSTAWNYLLRRAVLEDAPVGRVLPEPLVTPMGVDVVLVLERHTR